MEAFFHQFHAPKLFFSIFKVTMIFLTITLHTLSYKSIERFWFSANCVAKAMA